MKGNRTNRTDQALPPHAEEAEAALLGCILLEPPLMAAALERILDEGAFFSLRHREIWMAMRGLHMEGKPVDPILVQQRLRDHEKLDSCGGAEYLSGLPDKVPAASMLSRYLDEVWNKFLARRLIAGGLGLASALQAQGQFDVNLVAEFMERVEVLRREAQGKATGKPERLKDANEFAEGVYNLWFGSERGEPGLYLPRDAFGDFPFKVRGTDLTFVVGDSGSGKSTFLQYACLHLAAQGCPVIVASMEQRPPITVRMFVKQLLGRNSLPDNKAGYDALAGAMGWLQDWLQIYDFLGITDWRELLRDLQWAATELKSKLPEGTRTEIGKPLCVVLVDSVMRLGIAEDDFEGVRACCAAFMNWCQEWNAHMFVVNHVTKGEGGIKERSRGSKRWTDAAPNIWEVERNEKKGQKVDDLHQKHRERKLTDLELAGELGNLRQEWDARMTLHKQRLDGSRQNGRRYLWFDRASLQFSEGPREEGVDWLSRWGKEKGNS